MRTKANTSPSVQHIDGAKTPLSGEKTGALKRTLRRCSLPEDFRIHYRMPSPLEACYQEWGRAGRDGQEGRRRLLFPEKVGDADCHACEDSDARSFRVQAKAHPTIESDPLTDFISQST
jgi:hypothetical protein